MLYKWYITNRPTVHLCDPLMGFVKYHTNKQLVSTLISVGLSFFLLHPDITETNIKPPG